MVKYVRQPPSSPADVVWIAGGEVDEYHISLGFFGDDLDPEEVTSILGGSPTSICRKGDAVASEVAARVERTGRWLVALPIRPGEALEPQLEQLFASLNQNVDVWQSLTKRFKARFSVGAWIRSWNRGLEISPTLLKSISERGLGLGIDIYSDSEDDDV